MLGITSDSQHFLTWYIRNDEKSLLWSDFLYFSAGWMLLQAWSLFVYVLISYSLFLSVKKEGKCIICLLIPMNNKDWYFFLWKKSGITCCPCGSKVHNCASIGCQSSLIRLEIKTYQGIKQLWTKWAKFKRYIKLWKEEGFFF